MGDKAGGEPDGAIGPEVDARSCQRGNEDCDGDDDPFSQVHVLRAGTNNGRSYRDFCAPPTEGSACTVTPGGGTSSSGTKKSDISATEGSTR